MASYQEKAQILRTEKLGRDIYRFTLQAPQIAAASRPGQFVMVRPGDGYDPLLRRPFSIHQATADGQVQILFKVVGKGTAFMAALAAGRFLDLVGPLGQGFRTDGLQDHLCLLGGGMGIAPLLFLASTLHQSDRSPETVVLLGARSRDELEVLAGDFTRLGLDVRVATDDGTWGHHGLVTDLLADLADLASWAVCACGPYPMMRTAAKQCEIYGWQCQVSLETMMACGIAACLGCAIPGRATPGRGYVHVCKQGPVFAAEEVEWL